MFLTTLHDPGGSSVPQNWVLGTSPYPLDHRVFKLPKVISSSYGVHFQHSKHQNNRLNGYFDAATKTKGPASIFSTCFEAHLLPQKPQSNRLLFLVKFDQAIYSNPEGIWGHSRSKTRVQDVIYLCWESKAIQSFLPSVKYVLTSRRNPSSTQIGMVLTNIQGDHM